MRLRSAAPAIPLVLVTTLAANAQPFQGVYVGAGAGYNITQAVRATPLSPALGSNSLHLDEGGGFAGVGSLGYGLGNGFRFEVEGDFRRDGLHQLNGTPFPTSASGNVKRYGAMANALFDMDIGVPWLYYYCIRSNASRLATGVAAFGSVSVRRPSPRWALLCFATPRHHDGQCLIG